MTISLTTTLSLVVKNISGSDRLVLGMPLRSGQTIDLFVALPDLTEQDAVRALSPPRGEIYLGQVRGALQVLSNNLPTLVNQSQTDTTKANVSQEIQDTSLSSTASFWQLSSLFSEINLLHSGLSGDMVLMAVTSDAYVHATDLNAAAAGTFIETLTVNLVPAANTLPHLWANFAPVVTPTKAVASGAIGLPVINSGGTPKFNRGTMVLSIAFDTDAGVTKTYVATDVITITVHVTSGDTLLGWPVAALVKTYTVI